MLPKEHGAYGQMAMPIVTSLVVSPANVPATLLAIAVVAGFLAHEPLLVLLGRRGGRATRESSGRAARWLAVEIPVLVVAGLGGLWWMAPDTRWSVALPLVPVAALGVAIGAGREKSVVAELTVAAAFSLVAVPVCLAAGATAGIGVAIAAVFGSVFITATLAVRGIIATTRGGGNPRTARRFRTAALLLASGTVAALTATATRSLLPWIALMAAAPGLGLTAGLALVPPSPARLRVIGWMLVATSLGAVLILAAGLAGVR